MQGTPVSQDVSLDAIGDGVFEIRLNRPERMNALGVATCAALERTVSDAASRRAGVVLFRGTGRAFCAGADLKERRGMDLAARLDHNAAIRAVNDAIASARFVTVAVLNGIAVGGGLELALACDLRLAAAGITLGLTESRIGAFPGAGGTQRLPRVIGVSRALHMMLSGEPVTSEYALRIGLVNEVVPAADLIPRAESILKQISSNAPLAVKYSLEAVNKGLETSQAGGLVLEASLFGICAGTEDKKEGTSSFLEKRAAQFQGR